MFDSVLIANRGEIACRVARTARAMGLRVVAVYSDADRDAAHVAMADEAVWIGGNAPSDSYLRGDRIIAAALEAGAGAIHPGYGFLSENAEFVEAVEAAGLVFVGPTAGAIRAMGLKDAAKALMAEAGVPVVPGYHGADQSDGLLAEEAARIGYPVLIKAVAGGGGKGMRLVESAEGFADGLASARAEARTAFGNDAVLIEKFVSSPRHIEVQVFGDGAQAVHLFERDCSLQRRHQKVIEEAPAPGMTDEMREAMGAAAVRAAKAIGYRGAGTVEFIVDGSDGLRPDRFWFMEMNTRLQVEHPVTEAITGVDLVEWQLRVAMGEPLPLGQEDLSINGHAFEVRLYAEDVAAGFLPATGRLDRLRFAQELRADSGVREGDEISPHYDPMIAKLISHGPNRAIALSRLRRGMMQSQVAGTVTNLDFLKSLAGHCDFVEGRVDTGLIARVMDDLHYAPAAMPEVVALATISALGLQNAATAHQGFALWSRFRRFVQLTQGDKVWTVCLQINGPRAITVDLGEEQVTLMRDSEGHWRAGGARIGETVALGESVTVFASHTYTFAIDDPLNRASDGADEAHLVIAPMPGVVSGVLVKAGDPVSAGMRMALLEAMKMEHTLCAPRDGVVAEVLVREGDQIEAGVAMIRLEESEEDAA